MTIMEIGKKIGSAVNTAADKTKEFASVTKLKADIASEQRIIQQAYLEIGKMYYEQEKRNSASPARQYCNQIMDSEEYIEELQARIKEIKGSPDMDMEIFEEEDFNIAIVE